MDATQFLLSTAVTITTILLIIVTVQLISLLKQLKRDHAKENTHVVKTHENVPTSGKKDKVVKKIINLSSLLNRIKIMTPHSNSLKKKFFKSS